MISRFRMILLGVLLAASLAMAGVLWHLRDREHQRLLAGEDSAPTRAPQIAPVELASLVVASDADDSLQARTLALPLPSSPPERARAILGKLLDLYAASGSQHPVAGGAASVIQVFLLPVAPGAPASASKTTKAASENQNIPLLAVVNLTGKFASTHPAGIEAESLTLLSICATLHANQAQIAQVRFLIDGEQRDTLAGHADLTRTYLTAGLTGASTPTE